MSKTIAVVAAHPDDEILGAGGTLAKHVLAGDAVYCLILGQGQMSRPGKDFDAVQLLKQDASAAGVHIGFKEIHFLQFPDNAFDSINLLQIVKEVESYFKNIQPQIVYTHYENDLNVDHRLTFQAVLTAARPCSDFYPREILSFETLSSTEWQSIDVKIFSPQLYVDVSNTIEKKTAALRAYATEIRAYPHPRSEEGVKVLAAYRGLACGLKYAEAFQVVRKIVD